MVDIVNSSVPGVTCLPCHCTGGDKSVEMYLSVRQFLALCHRCPAQYDLHNSPYLHFSVPRPCGCYETLR